MSHQDTWQRLHPLSPLARGWIAMLVVLGAWMNTVVNGVVNDLTGAGEAPEDLPDGAPGVVQFIAQLPDWMFYGSMAVAGALLVGAGAVYVWWFTRYQVTDTHVRLRTGLVFRQERQTRLDRVQALDIQRPLVARLLGLAELRFEVADAGESSVALRYLTHDHARQLRQELLAATDAGGTAPLPSPSSVTPAAPWAAGAKVPAVESTEELILALPMKRVVLARMLTFTVILLTLVAVTAAVLGVIFPGVILPLLAGFIPAVLGLGGAAFQAFEVSWGFRMYRTPEGLRLRYGLFNKTSQTVPTGRIQAMVVHRPLLWRRFRWSYVHVNVAGYGSELSTDSTGNRSVLLPVATDDDLHYLFRDALQVPDGNGLADLVVEGLMGEADEKSRYTCPPPRVVWSAPIVRRRHGYAVTPQMLLSRGGRVLRTCFVVPHNKLQSIGLRRGPVLRRLGLTKVALHSIAGPVHPEVARMDHEEAQRFVVAQLVRGRGAPVVDGLGDETAATGRGKGRYTQAGPQERAAGPSSFDGDSPPLPWAQAPESTASHQPVPYQPAQNQPAQNQPVPHRTVGDHP